MASSVIGGQDRAILLALGTICRGLQEFPWKLYNWIYPLLTKLELFSQDSWILASFFFSDPMDLYTQPYSVAVNEQRQKKKNNLANIQPSWPHTWSITHTWYIASQIYVLFL